MPITVPVGLGGAALLAALVLVARYESTSADAPPSTEWSVTNDISKDNYRFVVIRSGLEKQRKVYDAAVSALCGHPSDPGACAVAFFAYGDPVPPSQRRWFEAGGSKAYRTLAFYWSGGLGFTQWDCDRAGADGSPIDALCGPAVSANYEAALSLGTRTGYIVGCGWPQTNDAAQFESFLATVQDPARRAQYRQGFDEMNTGKGPDNPADCLNLRPAIERRASDARRTLGFSAPVHNGLSTRAVKSTHGLTARHPKKQ